MSMHLFYPSADLSLPSTSNASQIHLICAYEDGGVTLRRYTQTDRLKSVQGAGWETIWSVKLHTETSTSSYAEIYASNAPSSNGNEGFKIKFIRLDCVSRPYSWVLRFNGND